MKAKIYEFQSQNKQIRSKTIKTVVLALTLGLMSFSVVSIEKDPIVKTVATTPVKWKSEQVDLGEIPQGIPATIEFEFTNTGKAAVVITNVKASCGCTATDYTKEPIAPGKKAMVKATYNAAAKGTFAKMVTVTTNAEEAPKVLSFKGTVI